MSIQRASYRNARGQERERVRSTVEAESLWGSGEEYKGGKWEDSSRIVLRPVMISVDRNFIASC